jgi:glycosyltransferase involved in cell wall biosynthesis
MRPQPSISVVIPAYNAAKFITLAVDSVLAQTYPVAEILIVDDGSIDETAQIVSGLSSPVRLIRKTNGGPAAARNLGARQAIGDWLAFLDADDSWLPEKLERQMTLARPEVGLIHCLYKEPSGMAVPDVICFDDLWERNYIGCSTVLMRKELFLKLDGFDVDPKLVGVEDYNFWMRVAASGYLLVTLQDVLIRYTPAPGSLTQQVERFANAELVNRHKTAAQFGIDGARLKRKELEILDEYGRELLHSRDLLAARRFLANALKARFSPSRFLWWGAAFLPRSAFHLYGSLKDTLQ